MLALPLAPCVTLAEALPLQPWSPHLLREESVEKCVLPQRPYSRSEGMSRSKFQESENIHQSLIHSFFQKEESFYLRLARAWDIWKRIGHGPQPQLASHRWRRQCPPLPAGTLRAA